MSSTIKADTPMLRQYRDIKSSHMDAILFFRLGDFYEMFLDDAVVASKELDLTLTGRGKDEKRIPMCGVPYHAAVNYISKLVLRGYKVAICDQVEDASLAKGLTKREVVRVVTPGTVQGPGILDEKDNNYLVAANKISGSDSFGVSFVDISTGEFRLFTADNEEEFITQVDRLGAKEILKPEDLELEYKDNILINNVDMISRERAEEELLGHFKINSLTAFGIEGFEDALPAAWTILDYLIATQKNTVPQITRLLPFKIDESLLMDTTTIKNLELTDSFRGDRTGTLFQVLDSTRTAMGARRLKTLIRSPYINEELIDDRLDAVESLCSDILSREEIRDLLTGVYDLERLLSRIVSGHNNPLDCMALKKSLCSLVDISSILDHLSGDLLCRYKVFFQQFQKEDSPYSIIIELINNSISEDTPATLKDGRVIKPGFNEELDRLLLSFKSIRDWISSLEDIERNKTGIKSLKVRFNKVFGYYIEVSNSQKDLVPEHYIRKQTLTSAERFITPELKENESVLLHGEEKQRELEIKIYEDIVSEIRKYIPHLQDLAEVVADLDCLQSIATTALKNNYVRPKFDKPDNLTLKIRNGRHPVLEKNISFDYIANNVYMNNEVDRFILITGPNMAGKSTVMRQVALTVIMAQIGSFVPADSFCCSLVDRLFTRIGAQDNLYFGQSTFMVEMLETATILHNATKNSLIILDEIGRGTSTFDGMSIAGAVTDYIHNRIGARTMFATHYHELTVMEKTFSGLRNYSMKITESEDDIVFNYKLIKGPADKSYGIHVAKMAGVPYEVIEQAGSFLAGFEREGITYLQNRHNSQQMKLF
ncbi:MAG: DNA mismatch repair protein MutS [bacterium]|nr:DNA mismatch repair protein MutS [bacterium]